MEGLKERRNERKRLRNEGTKESKERKRRKETKRKRGS
jgi:hypothetical protein